MAPMGKQRTRCRQIILVSTDQSLSQYKALSYLERSLAVNAMDRAVRSAQLLFKLLSELLSELSYD